jgi:hypothetical protein
MRKALLIGINYLGTNNQLSGCINDALNIKDFLQKNGYQEENITLMTETSKDKNLIPTADNIIREMKKLVDIKEGELFLSYSGHGSSVRDYTGKEKDGKNETIVPLDMQLIIDDDLRKILVEPLTKNIKLTAIFDCCHSGTGLDLKYNYSCYPGLGSKSKRYIIDIDKNYQDSKGNVILISGCADPDYSSDTVFNDQPQGALTHAFLTIVDNKQLSYLELLKKLRKFMKEYGYSQVPQLSSGILLNLNENFEL